MGNTSRKHLYDEVWTDPVMTVAKRYGLSDVGLAKVCRKLGIPLPPRGYWAKLKAGEKVRRTPLPKSGRFPETVALTRFSPEVIAAKEEAELRAKELRDTVARAMVPIKQYDTHPVVAATRDRLTRLKDGRGNPRANGILRINVSGEATERALALFNALIQEMAKLGGEVVITANSQPVFAFNGATFSIEITERCRRVDDETIDEQRERLRKSKTNQYRAYLYSEPRSDLMPTGMLVLTAGSSSTRTWKDMPVRKLESRISDIVVDLVVLSSEIRRIEEERRRREERQALLEKRYQVAMKRRQVEREKFKALEVDASGWERAQRIRSYVHAAEARAVARGDQTAELAEWVAWANAKADWIDPLIPFSDAVLDAPKPKSPSGYWWAEEE